jgi:hypothetical protein
VNRRLLLVLAGFGTTAAAVFLMSGTAHALAPRPALRTPARLVVPTAPVGVTAPDAGGVTAVTPVAQNLTPVPSVEQLVEPVPTVVRRVATTLDLPLQTHSTAAHRAVSVVPNRLRAARSSRASGARAPTFANAGSLRAPALLNTRTRVPSRGSTLAFMLPGLSGSAVTPARSSVGSPFAALATGTAQHGAVTRWVTFPTADRTRPGFLVGSARPG